MNILEDIDSQIHALQLRKSHIQEKCSHPEIVKIPHGNSGNELTGREASYWNACVCQLCEKYWNEPQ